MKTMLKVCKTDRSATMLRAVALRQIEGINTVKLIEHAYVP